MYTTTLSAMIMAMGLALAGYFVAGGIVGFKSGDRSVTVKGLAEEVVAANEAVWQIQFAYASDNLPALYSGIHQAQDNISAFLHAKGFDATDITFQPVSLTDHEAAAFNSNRDVLRYVANGGVTLHTEQVDLLQQAVQKTSELVYDGVIIRYSDVKYYFTKLNDIKPDMLNLATQNARIAAKTFADNAQSRLGGIRDASQGLFTISDVSSTGVPGSDPMKKVRVVTTVKYDLK